MNLPIGSIILYYPGVGGIPEGWQVCDGTNGTPNMVGRFARGASGPTDLLSIGGSNTHLHDGGDTAVRLAHSHSGIGGTSGGAATKLVYTGTGSDVAPGHTHSLGLTVNAGDEHLHDIGNTGTASSLPPHKKICFIMRMI